MVLLKSLLEALGALGIHWQTLLVQAVSFLALAWLLSRFLFGPVGGILRARSQEVQEQLDSAHREREEAERLRQELEQRLEGIRDEARRQVQQAVQEGREERERILQQARAEAEQFLERARTLIEHDRRAALIELREQVADLAFLAASKALPAAIDEAAQRRAIDEFVRRLELEAPAN
jgi:F-type H+-transporting ATPase subunit b